MKLDDPYPVLRSAQSAVLLIFFMPSGGANRQQRALLSALADSLQKQLGGLLRILRIDETNHPDVVQSFAITQTPAFVLVRRGIELWRQEGLSDEATLVGLIQDLLTEKVQ
ncbi:thioredoxin family protein [Spirosoma arcticum]